MDYWELEMEFKAPNGSKVVLKGMEIVGPQFISTWTMEAIFRHKDVAYAT